MARYFDYIKINRPEYYSGRSDRMLSRIADELDSLICGNENEWTKYCLAGIHKSILADALVEFAEDVYNDIGIWNAYENYNREFFGTPLPMTLSPGSEIEFRTITPERVAHLVWVFISELFYCPAIFPDDPQLFTMSGRISNFLNERFEKLPRDSGVKQFLSIPVRNYHEIKKRLMWLGTQSYFFRLPYENFRNDLNVKNEIEVADDFICAETTPWSGLGVIDILASLLNISSSQNKELRSWYERHLAIYRMENKGKDFVHALNLINNVSYRVKMDVKIKGFNPGETVIGSLVPWNGEWYWSGIQRSIKSITENKIRAIRNEFIRTNPQIVFRYEKNMANIAIESDRKQRERFISHFGDSLVVFPNGKSFRKEIENFYIDYIESIKKEMGKESEPKKKRFVSCRPPTASQKKRYRGLF